MAGLHTALKTKTSDFGSEDSPGLGRGELQTSEKTLMKTKRGYMQNCSVVPSESIRPEATPC